MEQLEQVTTQTINLTDAAAEMVRNLLVQKDVPDHGLRVLFEKRLFSESQTNRTQV